ncbi:hypothetical protein ACFPOU_07725 [Massilia jejuensis]|uniref:DUF4145 domain-containing protein n=1 Tax=Massilia jejuensis TaxID=648894 RepID=A0ABW0PHD7_9BURK
MSQIELAVTLSRRLESLLEQQHHASGKGLHEKVSSVEAKLPAELVKTLRYIATMRNSVVHEEGFVIDDPARFSAQGDAALRQLGGAPMSSAMNGRAAGPSPWTFMDWVKMAILMACTAAGTTVGVMIIGGFMGAGIGCFLGFALGGHMVGDK